ncbi:MAG: hypothetical protein J2P18_14565 [Nocardia sp.]|nr:hypothetical protein [Nocardia sp.]
MDLRPELLPPPVEEHILDEFCREIARIESLIWHGEPVAETVAAFNERTGRRYHWTAFAEYDEIRDLEDFALEAARPPHPRVPDLTRDELAEIIARMRSANLPAADLDYYLRLVDNSVPHPAITDLIRETDAEPGEIADAAIGYKSAEPPVRAEYRSTG